VKQVACIRRQCVSAWTRARRSKRRRRTIKRWHDNWLSNCAEVVAAYGERWFRVWHLFLTWSTIIAGQGNAACFQVVLNKNIGAFNRTRWIDRGHVRGDRANTIEPPQLERVQAAE
jgi:hypothetical protein